MICVDQACRACIELLVYCKFNSILCSIYVIPYQDYIMVVTMLLKDHVYLYFEPHSYADMWSHVV